MGAGDAPGGRGSSRVGAFTLDRRLGHGGMGVVWAGTHDATGTPVAIKVMTAAHARSPEFRRGFVHEVQSVARLSHPSIVRVYDHGVVDDALAARGGGELVAGSPWLVMERATLGDLRRGGTITTWPALRAVLLQILDALAHAHARGVVHRDLKLSNVLTTDDGEGRTRLMLCDFGLARALDEERAPTSGGTPGFMAPEQIRDEPDAQRAWTDLYALGCLTFALATDGRSPFRRPGLQETLRAHLEDEPAPLRARFPVPEGLGAWVARLLRKTPSARYRRAADAAEALRALPDDGRPGEASTFEARPLVTLPVTASERPTVSSAAVPRPDVPSGASARPARPRYDDAPPIPPDWRSAHPVADDPLPGVGLGLFGLRPVPFVGRSAERDALWAALRDAARTRRPRVATLVGLPGTGKSRLAAWLAERAHELGAATPLRAVHSPIPGAADGLRRMWTLHLGALGASGRQVTAKLVDALGSSGAALEHVRVLQHVLGVEEGGDAPPPGMRTRAQRALLSSACDERPAVVWIDDAHWGAEALSFVAHLLEADDLPVLCVLTVRADLLSERPMERAALEALAAHERCTSLSIDALDRLAQEELVARMLGLEGALVASVGARTAGTPLFAVQLVGDWVERGVLEVGPEGFRMREGAEDALPDDIHALWRARVQRLVDDLGDAVLPCLEIAAALGQDVDAREWRVACDAEAPPPALLEQMFERRLARPIEDGFAFSHGMLRESLERSARAAGRWSERHARCAAMIERLHGDLPEAAARLGMHRLEAGQRAQAIGALLVGARYERTRGHDGAARGLLEMRREALSALEADDRDARVAEGHLLAGMLDIDAGDFERAERRLELAAVGLPGSSQPPCHRGRIARLSGRLTEGYALTREAIGLARAGGDVEELTFTLTAAAFAAMEVDPDRGVAGALFEEASALARASGNERILAEVELGLCLLCCEQEKLDEARRWLESARAGYRSSDYGFGLAHAFALEGEVARVAGMYAESRTAFERSIQEMERLGVGAVVLPRAQLGVVLAQGFEPAEAARVLEPLRARLLSRTAGRLLVPVIESALLLARARAAEGPAFDVQLERARSPSAERPLALTLARLSEASGDAWADRGDLPRARAAWRFACHDLERLRRVDEARRVEARAGAAGGASGAGQSGTTPA